MNTSRRFQALVVSLCLTTFFALGAYWYRLEASYARMRADTLAHTEQVAMQLANGVSEQMTAVMRSISFVMDSLRAGYGEGRQSFEQVVHAAYAAFPADALVQVGVIDTDGYLTYSNLGSTDRVYLGDREHFRVHADHPTDDQLFISKPVFGRMSKLWSIQFTRPIRRNGQFAGVLVLSISPIYLSTALENLGLGNNDIATLFRSDGSFLARSNRIAEHLGKSVKAERPFLAPDAGVQGVFHDESTYEPTRRTFAWRRFPSLPVIVVVGLSETDVLAPVEREIQESQRANAVGSLLMLGFVTVIVVLLLRVERQKQRLAENEAFYRSLFEKNASVKLLMDAVDGRIVAANPAACAFYGYARETLEKMNISDINCLSPESTRAEIAKAVEERRSHFLFPHRLANGEIRQVEVYSGPLQLEGRSLLYSIVHDVTERSLLQERLKASEARYRGLFEVVPDGMILVDSKREICFWNSATLSILGVDEKGLKGRQVKLSYRDGRPVPKEEYPTWVAIDVPKSRGLYAIELASGGRKWIAVNTRQLPPEINGGDVGGVVSFSDITRLVALEESLLISQSVFDAAAEGIMVTGPDNHIVRVNPAFTRITGYAPDEALGQTPSLLASGHHDQAYYLAMYQSLAEKGSWEGEVVNRRKDGSIFVERLKISTVKNKDGALLRYVALLSDITVKKQQEQDIWHQAHYDPLTQLPNRTLFLDRLGQALAQANRREQRVGVLFIDLDKFKPVNDTYGHQVGDELLRQVAHRISINTREEDTVARLGGDEFVVLLPAIKDESDCLNVADKILESLIHPFRLGEVIAEISASIGVALSSQDGSSAEMLLKKADEAMYRAKAGGRRTIRRAEGG